MRRFVFHCCALDPECRTDFAAFDKHFLGKKTSGRCWRVSLSTPWAYVALALVPGDRFVHTDGRKDFWMIERRTRRPAAEHH